MGNRMLTLVNIVSLVNNGDNRKRHFFCDLLIDRKQRDNVALMVRAILAHLLHVVFCPKEKTHSQVQLWWVCTNRP